MAMWHSSTDTNISPVTARYSICYLQTPTTSGLLNLFRRDLLSALVSAGCAHLAVKVLNYLDSNSLLAASMVSTEWQQLLLSNLYAAPRFRERVRKAIFSGKATMSRMTFSLEMARAAVVDVTVDDDLNIFTLALLSGRPHVMSCSLLTKGKRRWVHRFQEQNLSGLTCIAAGLNNLVALGDKKGRIHVYEVSTDWKCLRLTTILAHHTGAIHNIILSSLPPASRALFKSCGISGHILSCSDDMTVGVVTVRHDGSLMLNKLLHGHVSRVRAIHSQGHHLLSGSDDRSVKLWSLRGYNKKVVGAATNSEKPLATLTGHSGPVTGVLLALPKLAFSAAGCTVRLWDVEAQTCLKLLQHEPDCPVTSMSWISTFQGIVTVDGSGKLRTFSLEDIETTNREIVAPSSEVTVISGDADADGGSGSNGAYHSNSNVVTLQKYSPKQSLKFYGSQDPRFVTAWPENTILKLESIPHHFSAFSLRNLPHPSVTVHCLDYVLRSCT